MQYLASLITLVTRFLFIFLLLTCPYFPPVPFTFLRVPLIYRHVNFFLSYFSPPHPLTFPFNSTFSGQILKFPLKTEKYRLKQLWWQTKRKKKMIGAFLLFRSCVALKSAREITVTMEMTLGHAPWRRGAQSLWPGYLLWPQFALRRNRNFALKWP